MNIKAIALAVYNYTHIFVGAGAVVVSFLDTQQLPPKAAAVIVLISQGLRVLSDALTSAKQEAPLLNAIVSSTPVLPPVAPLAPVTPAPVVAETGTVAPVAPVVA